MPPGQGAADEGGDAAALSALRARLAALPADTRDRVGGAHAPSTLRVPLTNPPDGFSSRLPGIADLVSDAAGRPPPTPQPPGPLTEGSTNPFLAALADSTSFHSVDALPSMAAAFGLRPVADLAGLSLSVLRPRPDPAAEARRRSTFKQAVRVAWAAAETEAGVAAARAGDPEAAARHYAAALSFDPSHADALVARGAAAANARRFGAAIADFEAALAAEPGHKNAREFLSAVRARAEALGVSAVVEGALARPPPGLAGVHADPPERPAGVGAASVPAGGGGPASAPTEEERKRRRGEDDDDAGGRARSPSKKKSKHKKERKRKKEKKEKERRHKDRSRRRRRRRRSGSGSSDSSGSSEGGGRGSGSSSSSG
jgi:tetratricopeptide (TPR) repeat protein